MKLNKDDDIKTMKGVDDMNAVLDEKDEKKDIVG